MEKGKTRKGGKGFTGLPLFFIYIYIVRKVKVSPWLVNHISLHAEFCQGRVFSVPCLVTHLQN